jgi:FkbM family methyltransferase
MKLKHTLITLRNLIVFKSIPSKSAVRFIGRGLMYVDLTDSRGRRVRQWLGSTRYRNTFVWRKAVARLEPDVALDVGANYGEIAFSSNYPEKCKILLIEANAKLVNLLQKSVSSRRQHPNNWRVVNAAATDKVGHASFHINKESSGTSRLLSNADNAGMETEQVETIRIEDLLVSNPKIIVFKVDVEGHEVAALRGMHNCLKNAHEYFGIVEISEKNLLEAGSSAEELWELVRGLGKVALFDVDDQLIDVSEFSWKTLLQISRDKKIRLNYATDLIMYKSVINIGALTPARHYARLEHLFKKVMPSLSNKTPF